MRYAYFPAQRRVAIAVHEHFWIYDTLRPAAAAPPPEPDMAAAQATDSLATLDRLAELRHQGLLSEEEFATTKAELLRRL
jgi:hypothetical protein